MLLSAGVEVDEIVPGTYVKQLALAATLDHAIYMTGNYKNWGWGGGKTQSM